MKAKQVIGMLQVRQPEVNLVNTQAEVKHLARLAADNDKAFENVVFELGLSVLAKKFVKWKEE